MKNRFFKLPFSFEEQRLLQDLKICVQKHWALHFNQNDFSGQWTSISLRSATGLENDIYAHPSAITYIDTPLLAQCPYFTEIISGFDCPKEAIRLLSLAPGSEIREHTDLHAGYEYGFFRVHVPIQTDTQVSFRVDGWDLPMKVGECWYANFNLPHSVHNQGATDRIHLIIDCKRNAWSDELFARAGFDFEEEKRSKELSRDTKEKMIAQLELMDTDTSRALVAQLRLELQSL